MDDITTQALSLVNQRFGRDTLVSLATFDGARPSVRIVDGYYEDGCFYSVTYALSQKMRHISRCADVAVCGEWFTAHGVGENIGHPRAAENAALAARLRHAFAAWYDNGHTDENDPHTCILRVRLTDGILFSHGTRYDIDFTGGQAKVG
ncbi:MAG: pyridoxamine 5'-phosphate oxidase family protein [Eubacteriales bacterium]|nr:pyridoxamine 5'-phosphate oxidase family protein [Eubacteriales bacterium]